MTKPEAKPEAETVTEIEADPFQSTILEGATFRIDWMQTTKLAKHGREGGDYSVPCVLTEIKGYVVPVLVELRRRDYDSLRLLKMQGIKVFTCTLGVKGEKERYAPRVWSGGKDW